MHDGHERQAAAGKMPLEQRLHFVADKPCDGRVWVFQTRVNTEVTRCRDAGSPSAGVPFFQLVSQGNEVRDNCLELVDVRLRSWQAPKLGGKIIVGNAIFFHGKVEREMRGNIVNLEHALLGEGHGLDNEADLWPPPELLGNLG